MLISHIFKESNNLLLECNVNSESLNNTSDNIYHFSDDNPENNEGSNSNSEDNPENNEGSNSNSEDSPENNEGSNSNSDDSNSDDDDPQNNEVEEVGDPEHNGPERIMDDLDKVDNAKDDPEALEYLQQEYSEFFHGTTTDQALKDIKNYLEEEFKEEVQRSEFEADAEEAKDRAEKDTKLAEIIEKKAEETIDPEKKKFLEEQAEFFREQAKVQSELEKEAISKANGT